MDMRQAQEWTKLAADALRARRPRVALDDKQRMGFPQILVYEISEGPHKGQRIAHPPTVDKYPLPKKEGAEFRHPNTTAAYRRVVLHEAAHEALDRAGFWQSDEHWGPKKEFIDNRAAS